MREWLYRWREVGYLQATLLSYSLFLDDFSFPFAYFRYFDDVEMYFTAFRLRFFDIHKHQCERVELSSSFHELFVMCARRNGHVKRDIKSVDGCYKQINKTRKRKTKQTSEWMAVVLCTYHHDSLARALRMAYIPFYVYIYLLIHGIKYTTTIHRTHTYEILILFCINKDSLI